MIARNQIFWPVLVQMLLTMLVFVRLINVKVRELKAGKVDLPRRGLHEDAWPDSVLQVNNNIRNQFELPVLFYGASFILWGLEAVGVVALVLAWLFVASRIVHAWIHLGSNYIPNRRRMFTVGWWILMALILDAVWQLAGRALTAV
jgi:hypothetical protein